MNLAVSEQSVSIIVPTLNEEENIAPLVSQITACAVPFREILFVDDHSTDATREAIHALEKSQPIRLIEQDGEEVGLASAIMSIGAYNPWIRSHCTPEQAIEMANAAGARFIMPVHHQTFRLSFEPLREPIERFEAALAKTPERIALREIGETFVLPV